MVRSRLATARRRGRFSYTESGGLYFGNRDITGSISGLFPDGARGANNWVRLRRQHVMGWLGQVSYELMDKRP
jgi:hypothetical protein